jgi:hypothetical protein
MVDPDRKSSNVPRYHKAVLEDSEAVPKFEQEPAGPHAPAQAKTLPEFVYEPLGFPKSICILELLPGTGHEYIRCRLYEVTTDQAPQYEALSYVWGEPADKRQIVCCGGTINIPTNLRDLLQRIRNPFETKRLWADAICINQSDKTEVGHQVGQMASIYSTAERVIIWLGLEDPFESFGHDMYYLIDHYRKRLSERDASEASFPTAVITDNDDDMHDFWIRFGDLIRQPWFGRLWVVQEAGLARSAVALFGERELDFDVLFNTSKDVLTGDYHIAYSIPAIVHFEYFPARKNNSRTFNRLENPDFLDMLEATADLVASDPRDYVFALLGHPSARVGDTLVIEPNYRKPHLEVFQELAITLLQQSQDLRLLSAVRNCERNLLNNDCPSWVPIWNREYHGRNGVYSVNIMEFDAHAGFPRDLQIVNSGKMLQVHGFVFDMITECTEEFEPERVENSSRKPAMLHGYFTAQVSPAATALGMRYADLTQRTIKHILEALRGGGYSDWKQDRRDFAAFRSQLSAMNTKHELEEQGTLFPEGLTRAQEAARERTAERFMWNSWMIRKRLFVTEGGLIGSGPALLRSGDLCCILFGGRVPFILRPTGSAYRLVGEAYINGVMHGEAVVDYMLGSKIRDQMFNIV